MVAIPTPATRPPRFEQGPAARAGQREPSRTSSQSAVSDSAALTSGATPVSLAAQTRAAAPVIECAVFVPGLTTTNSSPTARLSTTIRPAKCTNFPVGSVMPSPPAHLHRHWPGGRVERNQTTGADTNRAALCQERHHTNQKAVEFDDARTGRDQSAIASGDGTHIRPNVTLINSAGAPYPATQTESINGRAQRRSSSTRCTTRSSRMDVTRPTPPTRLPNADQPSAPAQSSHP